jgi:plasmid rolling circle replication initiator protein Rep
MSDEVTKNIAFEENKNPQGDSLLLDKLAQLSESSTGAPFSGIKILHKRARAKYLTNAYTYKLSGLNSELKKSYHNTFYNCSNKLEQKEDKLTGKYCNNRWCIVCNRIRTAKLINGYKTQLDQLPDKYFVTLTVPNVIGSDLRGVIQEMVQMFSKMVKTGHNQYNKLTGIRKTEVTYNVRLNNFHPHFHCIISGSEPAHQLVDDWLKHYPEANIYAQDIRPADDNSVMELFKYFSKIITNKTIYVQALDIIFTAMYGMRVYQAFGIKREVSEDIAEIQAEIYKDLEQRETVWTWVQDDWIDQETGELLTNYHPDEQIKKLISTIK